MHTLCRWRLDTSTLSWSTTVMRPMVLADKSRRRVAQCRPPRQTGPTMIDRSLCWTNTPNQSKSRIWREYHKIWSVRLRSLLQHPHSRPPLSKLDSKMYQLVQLPHQILWPRLWQHHMYQSSNHPSDAPCPLCPCTWACAPPPPDLALSFTN